MTTPKEGTIREIRALVDESYPIGAHLATLECEGAAQATEATTTTGTSSGDPSPEPPAAELPSTSVSGQAAASVQAADKPHFATDPDNGSGLAIPEEPSVQPTVKGLPVPANATGASYISPRMRGEM